MTAFNRKPVRFDPHTATETAWDAILTLRQHAQKEDNPNDPVPSKDFLRQGLLMMDKNPVYEAQFHMIQNEAGDPVAAFLCGFHRPGSPDYDEQKHIVMFQPFVMEAYRRQGIGTQLVQSIKTLAEERGVTLIQAGATTPVGFKFAEYLNAEIGIEVKVNRLYAEDIDKSLVKTWKNEGDTRNPDVTIETWVGLPPEEDLEAYSVIFTEVYNQQPFGDTEGLHLHFTPDRLRELEEQHRESGTQSVTKITREADGSISGLTDITHNPETAHRVSVGLTGVGEQYRGRGLGKWLKADMTLYILEHYPDIKFIETTNASSNAAMLSINERLGYRLYKHDILYKIPVSAISIP